MKRLSITTGLALLMISSCQTNTSNLIFKDSAGHSLTEADLANVTGRVNYEVTSDQHIDPKAKALHEEARKLGQEGQYDSAIAKLEEAIKIQPTWAYPTYDLAYTYLLKDDYDNALKFYKKTDELAPKGFFTAKTALYTLSGEQSGVFPKGLYKAYMQIEWTNNESEKLRMAKTITENLPEYAPAWKELSALLTDKEERLKAIEQGLSKDPDADTKGILLINKAILLNEGGKKEEAKQLLGHLIFSADATTADVELAKFTLRSMAEK